MTRLLAALALLALPLVAAGDRGEFPPSYQQPTCGASSQYGMTALTVVTPLGAQWVKTIYLDWKRPVLVAFFDDHGLFAGAVAVKDVAYLNREEAEALLEQHAKAARDVYEYGAY